MNYIHGQQKVRIISSWAFAFRVFHTDPFSRCVAQVEKPATYICSVLALMFMITIQNKQNLRSCKGILYAKEPHQLPRKVDLIPHASRTTLSFNLGISRRQINDFFFFFFFSENRLWYFIQIVSCMKCQSLFSGKKYNKKYIKMQSAASFTQHKSVSVYRYTRLWQYTQRVQTKLDCIFCTFYMRFLLKIVLDLDL